MSHIRSKRKACRPPKFTCTVVREVGVGYYDPSVTHELSLVLTMSTKALRKMTRVICTGKCYGLDETRVASLNSDFSSAACSNQLEMSCR